MCEGRDSDLHSVTASRFILKEMLHLKGALIDFDERTPIVESHSEGVK